ncbi:MAG: hypothetical protein A2538_03375 [Candidatus Magasanikbacteria bacterium RIFOXYD2_FULL_41_14]|uniref:Type II secretion system protein GspG C-terminal domain-containing protein n=1 Tax=Candidatus Magasanikbacteria bacterium RIFOXYD2_FULL_41_14 TaxID=1798709 RepID=A0A1F6PG90_9BACT|nr:MAG: hypothetical protein A2538_03375 [Candidatus Magasanikbacteria bacterium RIFOXYD2_FULL_41_14]
MNKKGFTLIELLIVVAIIGLLSTLAVVALGSARVKARDSKRLADLKQLQTALELFYTDNNEYPTGSGVLLGSTAAACLNSTVGWATTGCDNPYMGLVPVDPKDGNYTYTAASSSSSYTITATLEGNVNGLQDGVTLSPAGIAD